MVEFPNKYSWVRFWKFDIEKIEKVIKNLNFELPTIIDVVRFNDGCGGSHEVFNKKHLIQVDETVSRKRASNILWHELCHGNQYYKYLDFDSYMNAYNQAGGNMFSKGYDDNYFEIEARKWEEKYSSHLLTKNIWSR